MALSGRNEIKAFLLCSLALLSYGAEGARRGLVETGSTIFDVTTFGAKADSKTDSAMAFIRAWNAACQSNGTATLVIPTGTFLAGEVIFQGPCNCSGPINIEVQAKILAQPDLSEYPNGQWFLINDVDGLVLTGGGTFHGQGEASWGFNSCGHKADCKSRLPVSLVFEKVNNTIVKGINFINSKGFHVKISDSHNYTVQNLNITAPGESPNTDGIHISSSDNIKISESAIGTGDDCISIGDGSTNIAITNIICGPGHGISVGSLGKRPEEQDVKGVVVTKCTLSNTTNGLRIKTWHGSTQLQASSIFFEDIVMNYVKNPIIINQHYSSKSNPTPSHVKISDVHFKNIRGTTVSNVAVNLDCSPALPCEGVELVDIDFTFVGLNPRNLTLSAFCANAKAIFTGKQNPSPCS